MNPNVIRLLGTAFGLCVLPVAACTSSGDTLTSPLVGTQCADLMTFVVAVDRANQAAGVGFALDGLLEQAIRSGAAFTFIESDGTPSIVTSNYQPAISDANNDALEKGISDAKKFIINTISAMAADSDGNDTLGGASLAADSASSTGVTCNTLVVIGAGNSDRGELDITAPGVLSASGEEVAAALKVRGALPRFGDVRTDVALTGIGYTAADSSQPPLRQADRDNLTEIYTRTFTAAGASSVTDLRVPRTGSGPSTDYTVNPVPGSEQTPLKFCGTTVFDNTSQLGFFQDTAQFRELEAARATLTELATRLVGGPDFRVEIVGTTANWGDEDYKSSLSNDRVAAAADILIAAGISPSQITGRGVGSDFPEYDPHELLPDGTLDPVIANTNRSVRITVTGC
jgi:outer membrane protein OmpA-like peptidoglycan-associated protein